MVEKDQLTGMVVLDNVLDTERDEIRGNQLIMYLHVPRKLMKALPLVRRDKSVKKPKQLRRLLSLTKDQATELWMPTLTSLWLSYHGMPESRREKKTLQHYGR